MEYTKNKKVPKKVEEKKVLDYIVFTLDMDSGEMRAAGSVFESKKGPHFA